MMACIVNYAMMMSLNLSESGVNVVAVGGTVVMPQPLMSLNLEVGSGDCCD